MNTGQSGYYYIQYKIGNPFVGSGGTFSTFLHGGTESEALAKLKVSNLIPRDKLNEVFIVSMRKL